MSNRRTGDRGNRRLAYEFRKSLGIADPGRRRWPCRTPYRRLLPCSARCCANWPASIPTPIFLHGPRSPPPPAVGPRPGARRAGAGDPAPARDLGQALAHKQDATCARRPENRLREADHRVGEGDSARPPALRRRGPAPGSTLHPRSSCDTSLSKRGLPVLLLMTSRFSVTGSNLRAAVGSARSASRPSARRTSTPWWTRRSSLIPPAHDCGGSRPSGARAIRFFVEELVRAFRERGDLHFEDRAYDLREATERFVPPTISALIASRVDRLPASARELLADAAALGGISARSACAPL